MRIKILLSICLSVLIWSCKKDKNAPIEPPVNPPVYNDIIKDENDRLAKVVTSGTTDTYLSGIIADEEGKPLNGVSVNCGSSSVTTNNKGIFQFPGKLSVNKDYAIVTASLNGYFKAIKTFTPNASGKANHYIGIKLMKANAEKTVSATGGNVVLDNKINLTFPDAAVVTSTGAVYTGQYKVSARYIDPASDNFFEIIPGLLAGLNDQNEIQALQSFGMANVELKDMSGNPLQIAPGKTVKMILPASANAPVTIPLWHFNEKYGLWIQAGTAIKSGDSYMAEVNHFSIWNLDIPQPSFILNLTLKDGQGNSLAGIRGEIFEQHFPVGYFFTDNDGKARIPYCPSNKPLLLKTLFDCDTVFKDISPLTSNREEVVNLESSAFLKTYIIKGKLTNCDNNTLANQPFLLNIQGNQKTIPATTDNNGFYTITTSFCNFADAVTMQAQSYSNTEFLFSPAATFIGNSFTYDARICDSLSGISDNFTVAIADPNLELVIRKSIGKPTGNILYGDIKNLDSINANKYTFVDYVRNLEGLQFCSKLTYIQLFCENISNLIPLQNLNTLKGLELIGGGLSTSFITDITPLQNLVLLETLSLGGTRITDFSVLQNFKKLKKLKLKGEQQSDLTPIKNLINLEELDMSGTKASSLNFLKDLVSLKQFTLIGGGLTDISALQNLANLKSLNLLENELQNLNALSNLINLEIIMAGRNRISDISGLQNLFNLTYLDLFENKISDISPLQSLNALKYLYVHTNDISDITPLINGVPVLLDLLIFGQSPGKFSQAQKDAFTASHPDTNVNYWD